MQVTALRKLNQYFSYGILGIRSRNVKNQTKKDSCLTDSRKSYIFSQRLFQSMAQALRVEKRILAESV